MVFRDLNRFHLRNYLSTEKIFMEVNVILGQTVSQFKIIFPIHIIINTSKSEFVTSNLEL